MHASHATRDLLLAHLGAKTQFIRHYSEGNNSSAEPWFAMTKGITIAIANTNSDGTIAQNQVK